MSPYGFEVSNHASALYENTLFHILLSSCSCFCIQYRAVKIENIGATYVKKT